MFIRALGDLAKPLRCLIFITGLQVRSGQGQPNDDLASNDTREEHGPRGLELLDGGLSVAFNQCKCPQQAVITAIFFTRGDGLRLGSQSFRRFPSFLLSSEIISAEPLGRIDYIKVCDTETLQDVERLEREAVMALAVFFEKARLIDNTVLCVDE